MVTNRNTLVLALAAALLSACNRGSSEETSAAGDPTELITPENVTVVVQDVIESGPSLAGALAPERAAVLRAEVNGSVIEAAAEKGQPVARGALLARIEDTSIRDAYMSARSSVRSAEQASQVAKRNAERSATLAQAGAIAERELETARLAASNAEANLADAAARLSLVEKQLANTQVRSPFNGIVADRPVSAGDVVSPGTPLYVVVDPSSMKLEALVPAAQVGALRVGAPVQFVVQGYPGRMFTGRIQRISPVAEPATRQIGVYVSIPNNGGSLVSGLYAEGRVGSQRLTALVVPFNAVDLTGATPTVVRVKNGKVERIDVQTGVRDEQNERIQLVSGVAAGDTLLLGAAQGISNGTPVKVQAIDNTPARQ